MTALPISPDTTPCCVCPSECVTDESGDTCIDASCAVCLHGCPAGLDRPCCTDLDHDHEGSRANAR